jgi:hypothetical protein
VKRLILSCLLLVSSGLMSRSAQGQIGPRRDLVLPGMSVDGVELGGSPSSFQAVFSQHPGQVGAQIGRSGAAQCPDGVYYGSDLARDTSVATAYLKGGAISQLSVQGPVFSLPNGLKTGATEEQVRQASPKAQMYVLLHSGNKVNGGRDLHYWVDEEAGVAFKLAWWQSKKLRSVSGIDIFPKGSAYRPEGCISTPQQWEKLK